MVNGSHQRASGTWLRLTTNVACAGAAAEPFEAQPDRGVARSALPGSSRRSPRGETFPRQRGSGTALSSRSSRPRWSSDSRADWRAEPHQRRLACKWHFDPRLQTGGCRFESCRPCTARLRKFRLKSGIAWTSSGDAGIHEAVGSMRSRTSACGEAACAVATIAPPLPSPTVSEATGSTA